MVPENIILLKENALPRNWEKAYGYDGEQRFLAIYWESAGDEAAWNDGYSSLTGADWQMYLGLTEGSLRNELTDDRNRYKYNLGYSEMDAIHWLLLDLHERSLYIGFKQQVHEFMRQHNQGFDNLWSMTEEQYTKFLQEVDQKLLSISRVAKATSLELCSNCPNGWIMAEDGGYDKCPICDGQHLILQD